MRSASCCLLLLGSLLLPACGGSGGGGAERAPMTYLLDVRIYESLTGTVTNSGSVRHDIYCAGDLSDNTTRRAFYTFIVDDLPAGAQVQSAVFTTRQYLVVGRPFDVLGEVVVDHVDVGEILDATDYAHVQFTLDIGTLSHDIELGLRTLDVTDAVRDDVQEGRGTTTLRLRHRLQTNVDGTRDYCGFSSPQWPEEDRRVSLIVTYTLP